MIAEGAIAAEGDHALIVARFADTTSAIAIYDQLLSAEIDGSLHIDGVLVAKADEGGKLHIQKMTDHSTRKGLKWGIVGGVVAGIFLPATIVGGAVALGVAGAAAGKARNLLPPGRGREGARRGHHPRYVGHPVPRLGRPGRGGDEEDAGGPGGQDRPGRRGDRRRDQGRRGRRRQRDARRRGDARRRLTSAPLGALRRQVERARVERRPGLDAVPGSRQGLAGASRASPEPRGPGGAVPSGEVPTGTFGPVRAGGTLC